MDLSPLHLHLMLNHVPVLGTLAAALALAWGLARRSPEVTRLGLSAAVLVALLSIPVYLTGDPAEHRLRQLDPSVDRDLIHEHEEKGEVGFIAVLVTGAIAVGALWRGRLGDASPRLPGIVCVALVVSFGLFAIAALDGGEIRHPELRAASPVVPTPAPAP